MPTATRQNAVNGTVEKQRKPYAELRQREYLKPKEIEQVLAAAKTSRNGKRDWLMMQMAFNHALRASELVDLTWDQVDLDSRELRVERAKNGKNSVHYLRSDEIRALRALQVKSKGGFVFLSERNGPMTPRGFHKQVAWAGERAKLAFPIHPHMLRHTKGYQLANRGVDLRTIQQYMGHKNIQHTVLYTELDPKRLKGCEQ